MIFLRTLFLLLIAFPAMASENATITVENAWAPPTLAGVKNGAVYLTIHNHGDDMVHLTSALTKVSKHIEVHTMRMEGDVMKMHRVHVIGVKPDKPAKFAPGGLHIMLIDLNEPLKEGDSFPLTLLFATREKVEVTVSVRKP